MPSVRISEVSALKRLRKSAGLAGVSLQAQVKLVPKFPFSIKSRFPIDAFQCLKQFVDACKSVLGRHDDLNALWVSGPDLRLILKVLRGNSSPLWRTTPDCLKSHLAARLYFLVLSRSRELSHQDISRSKERQVSGLPFQVGTLYHAEVVLSSSAISPAKCRAGNLSENNSRKAA